MRQELQTSCPRAHLSPGATGLLIQWDDTRLSFGPLLTGQSFPAAQAVAPFFGRELEDGPAGNKRPSS